MFEKQQDSKESFSEVRQERVEENIGSFTFVASSTRSHQGVLSKEVIRSGSIFLNISLSFLVEGRGISLLAQLVKNPPAMQETPVRFLGWENPLEKG